MENGNKQILEGEWQKIMAEQCEVYNFTSEDLAIIQSALIDSELELESKITEWTKNPPKHPWLIKQFAKKKIQLENIKKVSIKIEAHIK